MKPMILFLLATALLFPSIAPAQGYQKNYQDFITCQQEFDAKVAIGSTQDEVKTLLGEPRAKKQSRLLDVEEEWIYICRSTVVRVCFSQGKVVGTIAMPVR